MVTPLSAGKTLTEEVLESHYQPAQLDYKKTERYVIPNAMLATLAWDQYVGPIARVA